MRTDALLWAQLLFLAAAAHAENGALNRAVTQSRIDQTICVAGYAKGVSPATRYINGVKQMLMQRTRMNPTLAQYYELDHIIPLALGGHPRKLDNLALQIREGENGADRKDRIETKLQCLVCSHQLTLAEAQQAILEDWQAAYHKYTGVKCHHRKATPKSSIGLLLDTSELSLRPRGQRRILAHDFE